MSFGYDDSREIMKRLRKLEENSTRAADTGEKMLEVFNRIAVALETLSTDVRQLRADLNPALDKPQKLPVPAAGKTP